MRRILLIVVSACLLATPLSVLAQGSTASPHGTLALECNDCHTTEGWRPIKANPSFDHRTTSFPLVGRHTQVECVSCHKSLVFSQAGTQCRDCHLDIHRGQFAYGCGECHTPNQWNNEREMFLRHQQTRFPLTGVHSNVDCDACHADGQYAGVSTDCVSCHLQAFETTNNPSHVAAQFSKDCSQCHTVTATKWQHAAFADHAISGFALTGRHNVIACAECHEVNGQAIYTGLPTDCYSCHQANFASVSDPNHVTGNFNHNCSECHTTSAWNPATFDHSLSGFMLTGAHATVSCAACHTFSGQPRYGGTPTDCYSCHQPDFEGTANPSHVASNFPHDCSQCHTTSAWQPASFDHNASSFPLTGAHATVQCNQCHVNGQFAHTPTDCYSCHTGDFNNANNPNHASQNFPHDCTVCHNTTAWQPSTFDHQASAFPLTGRHTAVACGQCHLNGQFAGTPTDCYSCHQADYEGATDPNHAALGYPHDCLQCHSTNGWDESTFVHSNTGFPLTGAHASTSCNTCHAGGRFAGTPTACYTCHREDYDEAQNPPHPTGGFDHLCSRCHTTNAWQPSTFNHNLTPFPLTGAHVSVSCQSCHRSGAFSQTHSDCYSCHQADFDGVTDPNHVTNRFDHNCTTCHSTSAWNPATFDHSNTAFPLTGAHISVPCNQCHINGQFQGTPTDCYFCHQTDYNNATPNHSAANFPTTCQTCHNTTTWQGATFDHDAQWFPIYSGHHQGRWTTCADCHTNPNDFSVFSCITCHAHNQQSMDDEHQEVPGYVYDSQHCYQCHPTGGGGGRIMRPQPGTGRGVK